VVEVDDHKVGSGKPGEVTRLLQGAFDDAIHGRSEAYREWLDPIEAGASAAPPMSGVPVGGAPSDTSSTPMSGVPLGGSPSS
jgi:hypothetical protein